MWLTVLGVCVGHVVAKNGTVFPTDWDCLYYHVPLIDQWLQARSLYAPDLALWSFPGNHELIGLWLVAPFSGDFLVFLVNIPSTILLIAATVTLGHTLRLSAWFRYFAAIALLVNGVVARQLLTQRNDVAACALFLIVLCYGIRCLTHHTVGDKIMFGISLGLLVGCKFYAPGYAVVALVTVLVLTMRCHGWRATLICSGVWALGALIWGGYWYVRNAVVTGAPFYPQGHPIGAALYPNLFSTTTFIGNGRPELFPLAIAAITRVGGPCYLVAFVLFPVNVAFLVVSAGRGVRNQGWAQPEAAQMVVGVCLVGAFLVAMVTPAMVEDSPGTLNVLRNGYGPVRYGSSFLALGIVALAWLLQRVADGAKSVANMCPQLGAGTLAGHCVCVCLIGLQVWVVAQSAYVDGVLAAMVAGNVVVIGWILRVCDVSAGRYRVAVRTLAAAVVLSGGGMAIGRLSGYWHGEYARVYDRMYDTRMYTFLARQNANATRIGAVRHQVYPLFGSRRQFRVYQPTLVSSEGGFEDYLRKRNVTIVVPMDVERHPYVVSNFMRDRPRAFLEFRGEGFTVYRRVLKGGKLGRP